MELCPWLRASSLQLEQPPLQTRAVREVRAIRAPGWQELLWMIELLHELVYQNYRSYGIIVYMGSCRIYIINLSSTVAHLDQKASTYTVMGSTLKQLWTCRPSQMSLRKKRMIMVLNCLWPPCKYIGPQRQHRHKHRPYVRMVFGVPDASMPDLKELSCLCRDGSAYYW